MGRHIGAEEKKRLKGHFYKNQKERDENDKREERTPKQSMAFNKLEEVIENLEYSLKQYDGLEQQDDSLECVINSVLIHYNFAIIVENFRAFREIFEESSDNRRLQPSPRYESPKCDPNNERFPRLQLIEKQNQIIQEEKHINRAMKNDDEKNGFLKVYKTVVHYHTLIEEVNQVVGERKAEVSNSMSRLEQLFIKEVVDKMAMANTIEIEPGANITNPEKIKFSVLLEQFSKFEEVFEYFIGTMRDDNAKEVTYELKEEPSRSRSSKQAISELTELIKQLRQSMKLYANLLTVAGAAKYCCYRTYLSNCYMTVKQSIDELKSVIQ